MFTADLVGVTPFIILPLFDITRQEKISRETANKIPHQQSVAIYRMLYLAHVPLVGPCGTMKGNYFYAIHILYNMVFCLRTGVRC